MKTSTTANMANEQQLWGQPKGLFYLFFAELWERFSFYGMKALLILYMTEQLLYSDELSFGVFSAYMSLVYITPLCGGVLADQILGYRRSILWGGVLMALGHFILSIETPLCFYASLGLIIVGNGLFKPNISSLVGTLYKDNDTRRDAGFTIFYLGINIGASLAPLCCAWLAGLYGWHYGFGLAGIGMLVGLFCFQKGITNNVFGGAGKTPNPVIYKQKQWGLSQGQRVLLGVILSVPLFSGMIYAYTYEHYLVIIATILLLGYVGYILLQVSGKERQRLLVVVYFTILATLFSALFEQTGSSVVLFADRNVNLIGLTAAQTNSINPTFIMLLAIPFSMLWSWLNRKGKNPNAAYKFGLGLCFLGIGAIIFARSSVSADSMAQTSMIYLLLGSFVLTVGELCLSPIGLSKVTELSPPKYVAFIMGVWLSANFYGHFFAGKIAQLTVVDGSNQGSFLTNNMASIIEWITALNPQIAQEKGAAFQQLYAYVSVYAGVGVITVVIGLGALCLAPIVKRMMEAEA